MITVGTGMNSFEDNCLTSNLGSILLGSNNTVISPIIFNEGVIGGDGLIVGNILNQGHLYPQQYLFTEYLDFINPPSNDTNLVIYIFQKFYGTLRISGDYV